MIHVSGNQNQVRLVKRYFVGTTALRNGQVLCYQEDATENNADPKLRLGSAVEEVNSSNVNYIAGIVPSHEAGKTGPCWVELIQPVSGDIVEAEVEGTAAVTAGDLLELDATAGAFIKATAAAGDNLFRSLEAQATNSKVVTSVYKI